MRASHREIRKRILEAKGKITDEEFFSSKAYQAYLTDLTEAATKRYQRPIHVRVVADHNDPELAHTDFSGIFINACNEITWSMPSRRLRSLSIEGLNAHENGHNLFTDNRIWNAYHTRLAKGHFYPWLPKGLSPEQLLYSDEIKDALKDETDQIPRLVILDTAHSLANILEDGYIDARYSHEFPGSPARGITLNNLRIAELAPDITTMINKKTYDHNIILNMIIQYVTAGEVNNLTGYSGEFLDKLSDYIPVIDDCIYDEDARIRCEAALRIMIDLWPVMQRCFDDLRDKQQQQQQNQSVQGSDASSGSEAIESELKSQRPNMAENFQGKSSAVPSTGSYEPDRDQKQALTDEVTRVLQEETSRIAAHETGLVRSDGDGIVETNNAYDGSGYEFSASDMERILEQIADESVRNTMEEELSLALQNEAMSISYGNAHRNINVTVNRMATVDQELIDGYRQVAPQLLLLSKRMQRSVRTILQDKRRGGKQGGLIIGKRLDQHALHREDGHVFCSTRLPTEPVDLSVALLVDESGSMAGSDRITRARATAIVVQDFCEKLGIPIMIVGHTASSAHVELYSYADFNSVDRNDRYRIMDMSARYCNRDGAALRYVAEKLYQQPSEVKLLFMISDGQPNDDGYSGTAAEADLRGIKQEYSRKGIRIFAAAIGDDRDKLERIYGRGFLDITDLNRLPVLMTQLIAQSLPH